MIRPGIRRPGRTRIRRWILWIGIIIISCIPLFSFYTLHHQQQKTTWKQKKPVLNSSQKTTSPTTTTASSSSSSITVMDNNRFHKVNADYEYNPPLDELYPPLPCHNNSLDCPTPKDMILRKFYFKPRAKLICRKTLERKFNIETKRMKDEQIPLISFFNKRKYPYRHLFALTDPEVLEISKSTLNRIPNSYRTFPKTMEESDRFISKLKLQRFLKSNGFESNALKTFTNLNEFDDQYPVIIKPMNETGSRGVRFAKNHEELLAILQNKKLQSAFAGGYIIQEAVQQEYERTIHIASIDGTMLRMLCHERKLDAALSVFEFAANQHRWGQIPPKIPNDACDRQVFERFIQLTKFTGIGNFDVRVDQFTGHSKILEFNPRVPGTLTRDEALFGEFVCILQWNGHGILTLQGCKYRE